MTTPFDNFSVSDATLDLLDELSPDGAVNPQATFTNKELDALLPGLLDSPFAAQSACGGSTAFTYLYAGKESVPDGQWPRGLDLGYVAENHPTSCWLVADLFPVTANKTLLVMSFTAAPRMMLNRHYFTHSFAHSFLRTTLGDPVNATAKHALTFAGDFDTLEEAVASWNDHTASHLALDLQVAPQDLNLPQALADGSELYTFTCALSGCTVLLGQVDDTVTLWKPNGHL